MGLTRKLFGHCLAQSFHAPFRVLLKQKNTKTQLKKQYRNKRNIKDCKRQSINSWTLLQRGARRRNLRLALRVAYALHPAPTGNYTTWFMVLGQQQQQQQLHQQQHRNSVSFNVQLPQRTYNNNNGKRTTTTIDRSVSALSAHFGPFGAGQVAQSVVRWQ